MALKHPSERRIEVPRGHVAAVVTTLEMRAPAPLGPEQTGVDRALSHIPRPDPNWYRDLFRRVGMPWLWFSRLGLDDAALTAILHDPLVEVHALIVAGVEAGLLELDFRDEGICELSFYGLTEEVIGRGHGRWLMNRAIERAWSRPIHKFWVHTCTNDHPAALGFYTRSGFVPVRRQVEIADDPRLTGVLPTDAAPHIPIL
jgi:GNAT superfamily N-acetyltransferase